MLYNKGNIRFGRGGMKVIAKSVEMVLWTDINGKMNPVRFKIANEDESISVIKIDKVITIDREKDSSNLSKVYL